MQEHDVEIICLPLYMLDGTNKKYVQSNNGINLWKAGGRLRHENEIEILLPEQVQYVFSDFFPTDGSIFEIRLPNYVTLSAKCTKNSRSIQSVPSRDLGKWLLRQLLRIRSGVVVDYELLERKGIDAIYVEKWTMGSSFFYKLYPAPLGEYENFITNGITKRKDVILPGASRVQEGFRVVNRQIEASMKINAGDKIMHKAFGAGYVQSIENDMIKLDFNGTTKEFKYSWLVSNKMITVS